MIYEFSDYYFFPQRLINSDTHFYYSLPGTHITLFGGQHETIHNESQSSNQNLHLPSYHIYSNHCDNMDCYYCSWQ